MDRDTSTTCGLWGWRPVWLQRLARKEVYALVYSLIGIIQGMGFSYLTAVLSTIEKQFGIKSKETAWVFSGNEISQILFIFALPFLGLIKKRTLWTSLSMMLTAGGLFLCALPFFLRDKADYEGGWASHGGGDALCGAHNSGEEADFCESHIVRDTSGMIAVFVGFFISGIGSSFFHSFGIPYIDDNTNKNQSPAFLGLIYAFRTLGPGLGSILGSVCLRLYVVPGLEAGLREGDEGWLGAWWLGFVVVASLTAVIAPALALFPERLPSKPGELTDAKHMEKIESSEESTGKAYILETKACVLRLIKNKVYMWSLLSGVIALLAFAGMGTFFPKYLEYHFRQTPSDTGLSSLGTSAGTGLGILLGGLIIARFRPRARVLAGWQVVQGVIGTLALIVFGFMACPPLEVAGLASPCSSGCSCTRSEFAPTCSMDGVTLYFSPCAAGCQTSHTVTVGEEERTVYGDCACVQEMSAAINLTQTEPWWLEDSADILPAPAISNADGSFISGAVEGFCPTEDCEEIFILTMMLVGFVSFIGSTARVGGSIINLRVVEPQDKSASIMVAISALSLFALFPSPLLYGALMDSTCLVWGEVCGEVTHCQLYDTDQLRMLMSWVTSAAILVSTLCDVFVWRHVTNLKLYDDTEEDTNNQDDMCLEDVS